MGTYRVKFEIYGKHMVATITDCYSAAGAITKVKDRLHVLNVEKVEKQKLSPKMPDIFNDIFGSFNK